MLERLIGIKLVSEHVRHGKPMLRRTVCAFTKRSYCDDPRTREWTTEEWTVHQLPVGRSRRIRRAVGTDGAQSPSVVHHLPDGRSVLQVPPQRPQLTRRWEEVTPALERIALALALVDESGTVLANDLNAATVTVDDLRSACASGDSV